MNKKIFILIVGIIFLFSLNIFSQNNERQENSFSLNSAYVTDFVFNASKGLKTGFYYLGNIDLQLSFDAEKAKWWKGGSFFICGISDHGGHPSESIMPLQTIDNIEIYDKTQLYEFWYKQQFSNFYFLLGQSNMNAMFYDSDCGNTFLNSNFNTEPEITCNMPVSIFSKTTLGACFGWDVNKKITLNGCLYNGYTGTPEDNPYGVRYRINKKYGYLCTFCCNGRLSECKNKHRRP